MVINDQLKETRTLIDRFGNERDYPGGPPITNKRGQMLPTDQETCHSEDSTQNDSVQLTKLNQTSCSYNQPKDIITQAALLKVAGATHHGYHVRRKVTFRQFLLNYSQIKIVLII